MKATNKITPDPELLKRIAVDIEIVLMSNLDLSQPPAFVLSFVLPDETNAYYAANTTKCDAIRVLEGVTFNMEVKQ